MKSKFTIVFILVAFVGITTLSSCKSRCHCPTFSKQVTKSQTTTSVS